MFKLSEELIEKIRNAMTSKKLVPAGVEFSSGCFGCGGDCAGSCKGHCWHSCLNDCGATCAGKAYN